MTTLARRLLGRMEERTTFPLPFQQWVDMLNYNNLMYPLGYGQTLTGDREELYGDFNGLVAGAYQANGVVFACMYARMLYFTEVRFKFRQVRASGTGNLFGTPALVPLEKPWPNGTTGDLLARMIQHVDLAGNAYVVRQGDRLACLRPDWVSILLGSRSRRKDWVAGDPDTEVAGYVYKPGGRGSQAPEILLDRGVVAHFAPIPDPQANYRGMSWLTPLLREIQADSAMTAHRLKFMENGATVNMVVKVPAETLENFNKWVDRLEEGHRGVANAYKTMYLGAGADATPVGSNLQQMDFKVVQGAGEVRIALAARVPPTLLGISEGLQGSTLNAGNYGIAKRTFADGLIRPLWRNAAASLASIIQVPTDAELWYDDRDVAFLREDLKDAAEARQLDASTMRTLIDGGYLPDSVSKAVLANDWSLLKHSGIPPVQLQQQPSMYPTNGNAGTSNGSLPIAPAQLGA